MHNRHDGTYRGIYGKIARRCALNGLCRNFALLIPRSMHHKGVMRMGNRSTTDVFVVGGGPAGLAAAIALRERRLSVTLADGNAPPIEKPCGEGMSPETVAALESLGVNLASTGGAPFRGIAFSQPGSRVAADFPQAPGLGLRRVALHERLVARAAECGINFLWRTPVTGIGQREVHLASGDTYNGRWIVGATAPARASASGSASNPAGCTAASPPAAISKSRRGRAMWKSTGPLAPRLTSHPSRPMKPAS